MASAKEIIEQKKMMAPMSYYTAMTAKLQKVTAILSFLTILLMCLGVLIYFYKIQGIECKYSYMSGESSSCDLSKTQIEKINETLRHSASYQQKTEG